MMPELKPKLLPFKRKSGKPRAFLNEAGLYDYAVKALGRAMRTEADLRRLMQTRVEPGERGRGRQSPRLSLASGNTATWTTRPLPRPMPACARRTRSWGAPRPPGLAAEGRAAQS